MPACAKGKVPKKKTHQLADKIPEGEVFTDLLKGKWRLGKAIGTGGFGWIYAVSKENASSSQNSDFVMKVEPHGNGPLFCELNYYLRVHKEEKIQAFMKSYKLHTLGIPRYVAHGSHTFNGSELRFMVMDRYGSDLQKIFEDNNRSFSIETVLRLGISILYSLEFMHNSQYCHADIKAANLLTPYNTSSSLAVDTVYLVDFGLAAKYTLNEEHRKYKEDPKRRHDGTLDYTSIDAHKGVAPNRRSDLQILGYCLLEWLAGRLPWSGVTNKELVMSEKIKYSQDLSSLMTSSSVQTKDFTELAQYFQTVEKYKFDEQPNYVKLRDIFVQGLKSRGFKQNAPMVFSQMKLKETLKKVKLGVNPDGCESTSKVKSVASKRKKQMNGDSPSKHKVKSRKNTVIDPPPESADSELSSDTAQRQIESPVTGSRRKSGKFTPANAKQRTPASSKTTPARQQRQAKVPKVTGPVINKRLNGENKPPVKKKPRVDKVDSCTQTTPGRLKGLPRSRKT